MELQDRVALVTGGAVRVGRAIVEALAEAGCRVVVHYRHSAAEAASLVATLDEQGRPAVAVRADLAEPAAWGPLIDAAVKPWGRLDILVNNASLFIHGDDSLAGFAAERWAELLRVNLTAPAGLAHHAQRYLAADGGGLIVNLCDIAAERPWPQHLAYCASKAGLVSVTRALARALAPAVRVNGIAPGIAVFPESYPAEQRQALVDRVPLQRGGHAPRRGEAGAVPGRVRRLRDGAGHRD